MSSPSQYVNKDSKWIKIPSGGSYTGVYLGWEEGEKYRGSYTVNYKFAEGKFLSSSSKRLSYKMDNIPENTKICIKKFGAGMETVYEVEIVGQKEKIKELTDQAEWTT